MQRIISGLSALAIMIAVIAAAAASADAQRRNERAIRDTVRSLNAKIDDFGYTLLFRLRSISADRRVGMDAEQSVENLKDKMRVFEDNLNARRENQADVNDIIGAARDVDTFLRAHPQDRRIETAWSDVRELIGTLAANYNVTPDWTGRISNTSGGSSGTDYYPADPAPSGAAANPLTGTYRLNRGQSENIADIISYTGVAGANRQDLESKLDPPEELAISVSGNRVVLASSNSEPISFIADGREKTEMAGGRTVRVRATLTGDELTVSSLGGESDYTVTFAAEAGGDLRITRRVTTAYLDETVFADSVYSKTEAVARLGIDQDPAFGDDDQYTSGDAGYSSNDQYGGANSPNPTLSQSRIGEFIVPNGMVVTGVLENAIDTKVSQNNDRFKMTVQSPTEYRGAVIEGFITGVGRSGQISGRPNVTFNFERITMRDGRAYDFAGNVQSVKDHEGKDVRVDTEGTTKGDSQTTETAKRGGIGAGLGAIIGAIAGGGKGAVLGAIIGGGAGAGSVLIGGRDDVRLMPGSTLTVRSSSPIR